MNSVLQIIKKSTFDEFTNKGYSFNLGTGINSYSFLPPFLFEKSGSVTAFKINKVLHHNTKVTIDDSFDLVTGDILTDGDNKYINEVAYISDFKNEFYNSGYGYFQYEITVDGIDYKSQVFKLINIEFPYTEILIDLDINLNNRWYILTENSGSTFELDNGDGTTQTVLCDTLSVSGSDLYYGVTENKTYVGTGQRTILIKSGNTSSDQLAGIGEFIDNNGTVAYNNLQYLDRFIDFFNNGEDLLSLPIFPNNTFHRLNITISLNINTLDFSSLKGIKEFRVYGVIEDTRNVPLTLPTSPTVAMEIINISNNKNIQGKVDLSNQYGTIEFLCEDSGNLTGFTFGTNVKLKPNFSNYVKNCIVDGDFFDTLAIDSTDNIEVNLADNNMSANEVDSNIIEFNNKLTGNNNILTINGNNADRTINSNAAITSIESRGGTVNVNTPIPEMVIDLDIDLNNRWTIYAENSGATFELDNGDSTSQIVLCDTLDSGSGLYYGVTEDKTYSGTGLRTVQIKSGNTNKDELAGITEVGGNNGTVSYNNLQLLTKFIYFYVSGYNLLSVPVFPNNVFYSLSIDISLNIDTLDFGYLKGIKRFGVYGVLTDTRNIPLTLPTSPIVAMENIRIAYNYNIQDRVDLTNQYGEIEFRCEWAFNLIGFTFGSNVKFKPTFGNYITNCAIDGDLFDTLAIDNTDNVDINIANNNMDYGDVDNNIILFNSKLTGNGVILTINGNNAARTSSSDAAVSSIQARGGTVNAN